jgi:hypothetical protein
MTPGPALPGQSILDPVCGITTYMSRYVGDDLYFTRPYPDFVPTEQRWPCADTLRVHFESAAPGYPLVV